MQDDQLLMRKRQVLLERINAQRDRLGVATAQLRESLGPLQRLSRWARLGADFGKDHPIVGMLFSIATGVFLARHRRMLKWLAYAPMLVSLIGRVRRMLRRTAPRTSSHD